MTGRHVKPRQTTAKRKRKHGAAGQTGADRDRMHTCKHGCKQNGCKEYVFSISETIYCM